MASRRSLSVLEPIQLNQLHDAPHPPLKKRKICSVSNERAGENIVIRAHAASLSDDPYVLEPIASLPRSQLPFDWLDVPSTLSQIQSGSLFVANIPVLEADTQSEPVVLVVRLVSDGGLYVIERVERGLYALSKLVRSVEEGDVHVVVKASSHRVSTALAAPCTPHKRVDGDAEVEWWQIAQVDDPAPDLSVQVPAKRAKVDVVFGVPFDHVEPDGERITGMSPVDLGDRSSSCDLQMISVPSRSQDLVEPVVSREVGGEGAHKTAQSPQELLGGLREQYLQALYVSKASVAYFAKGPLPRCRAAIQFQEASTSNIADLIGFYREAILTAKKMDLKYRETLPTTLYDVVLSISDDEPTAPKKQKSKKKTLGRNGLYPEEYEFVRQWWKNRALTETGTSVETSRDTEIKKHVSDLRLRETQLQILLILETMALETATGGAKSGDQETSTGGASQKPKSKAKKSQDLNVMLELHLDRLCIWHAVSYDNAPISESRASGSHHQSGKMNGSDAMRDFCTEVIIPFYASRLPDHCKSITRKLGVSVGNISPFAKSAKKSPRKESGASERHQSQKSRRTLQRVLTDEQTASQRRQPSLNRSITAPSQIESKRETTPLLPVPSASVRGGIQKAKRAENREVDLFAVARQHETKLKRVQMLAEQKKELDAAILTLRKPNRELVAKDIAQDADRRVTSSSSRKPKNPVRNPLGQGVQVMATPKGSRKRDTVVGLPPLPRSMVQSRAKETSISFSSPFGASPHIVPGSVIKPNSIPAPSFTADVGAVQESPSRRPPQRSALGSLNDTAEPNVAESPIPRIGTGDLFRVPRRPAPQATEAGPSTPVMSRHVDADTDSDLRLDSQTRLPPPPPPLFSLPSKTISSSHSSMVFETPPKPGPVHVFPQAAEGHQASASGSSKKLASVAVPVTPEKSIYARLGWDDDDDDDNDLAL